ncbi:rho guanine nucleotide exchange factor [Coprinopsis cinerea okayama7|uniref:Rho guanine nucleotide exchange factor n=1 Tax=Coprinopsis cinerea (strain Okayama-7 / 130 / ATCC MYA-4618 / FGSC 9003) TaxID=240176 RepID=A8NAD0_COPC7|nr:rho guanine nucleotide exchange factor [Coprinopsis cinerea okayama7\|eukprot:XP_001831782.2 rho guanine nucleotide exchange factor [Coprinopsis cinerea okayama7\
MSSGTSSVAFPGSDPAIKQIAQPRGPHLPFRRISLPTAPTPLHRHSVVSVASADSVPEDAEAQQPSRPGGLRSPSRARPLSVESPRRRTRRRDSSVKPAISDAARAQKRRKIVDELYETEKAYVEGLDLIYSHFLAPLIESLDTPEPILNRATLTATFSNFIDIWNFHRSFFSALEKSRDSVTQLLLSHFPYLSLYNPFITQFSSIISSLTDLVTVPTLARPNPQYNATFAAFLKEKEADPRCGKLKLRDWLLTIVQRCPRYLLMLKDLINNTDPDDPEHGHLTEAHGLVSKITLALNASLHSHAQTLALLALQRSTSGLPFQLISPGRTLVKRGTLMQAERNASPRPREFLLFSDCLIWLASTDIAGNSWDWEWSMSGWSSSSANMSNGSGSNHSSAISMPRPVPPPLVRSRSKSEAELGRTDLVDLEVTVGSVIGEERRFEVLSPDGSFVVYAASEDEREEWVSSIRQAKAHLLVTLNATNPNSTLTSSSSTNHIRKSLQALPFHPSDDRLAALGSEGNHKVLTPISPKKAKGLVGKKDKKVETFFIADATGKAESTKPARACDACYETVFPIVEEPSAESSASGNDAKPRVATDTISSLSNLPAWVSMPSIPSSKQPTPQALMAIDVTCSPDTSVEVHNPHPGRNVLLEDEGIFEDGHDDRSLQVKERKGVLRVKPHHKLKSYHQILEDFEAHEDDHDGSPVRARPESNRFDYDESDGFPVSHGGILEEEEDKVVMEEVALEEDVEDQYPHLFFTPPVSNLPSPLSSPRKRREDTVRKSQRYSLPALALQTTPITARASMVIEDDVDLSRDGDETAASPNRTRRYSIVMSPGKSGGKGGSEVGREEDDNAVSRSLAVDKLSELLHRHLGRDPSS